MKSERMLASLDGFEEVTIQGKDGLGKGSFASVKLVRSKADGALYALKEVIPGDQIELANSNNVKRDVENLKKEIKAHRKFRHAHIIKFYDYLQVLLWSPR